MRKVSMAAAVMLLVAGFGLGAVCAYQYFQLRQECAQMVVRVDELTRAAGAAIGTAQAAALQQNADDARKTALFICEDNRNRQKNYLLAGFVAPVLLAIALALLFFSRRTSRQLE